MKKNILLIAVFSLISLVTSAEAMFTGKFKKAVNSTHENERVQNNYTSGNSFF